MVFAGGVSALNASSNAAYVTKAVAEAISAAKSTEVDFSTLFQQLRGEVWERAVYSYAIKDVDYATREYVSSPILEKLVRAHVSLVADGTSWILYNPASSGKTSAAKIIIKMVLGDKSNPTPGLLFTGVAVFKNNYFEYITDCFPDYQSNPAAVFKCVVSALSRSSTAKSPWLILDDFNHPGDDDVNLKFAEALSRQVSNEKLNLKILFMTSKKEMAQELLSYNSGQKILPFPGFTSPDSTPSCMRRKSQRFLGG